MGFLDVFKSDPDTLYLSLSELPQPRGAAIFSVGVGKKVLAKSHLTMDPTGIEAACRVLVYHGAAIKQCGYKKVVYKNLPDWAQARLKATLDAL